jgi:hypothetical protein
MASLLAKLAAIGVIVVFGLACVLLCWASERCRREQTARDRRRGIGYGLSGDDEN